MTTAHVLADTAPPLPLLAGWDLVAAGVFWAGYAGLLLAVGGAFFLALIHDRREEERRVLTGVVVGAAILATAATVAVVPVRAIQLAGQLEGATDVRALGVVLRSPDGISGLVRLGGLSLLLVGIVRHRSSLMPAVAGAGVAALSLVLAGHTVTGQPRWLAFIADGCHVVAASVWFGGLVMLGLVLRRRRGRSDAVAGARVVARFSGWATVSLVALLVAGVSLAWAEIRTVDAALGTPYGLVLLTKVAVVASVASVGAYNNRRLVPAICRAAAGSAGEERMAQAWSRLALTVRLEAVGLVLVLALTGVLVHLAPPRPYADAASEAPPTTIRV